MCLHSQERAVRRGVWVVWDVHAAEGSRAANQIVPVDDMAVGEDMGEGAFGTKLAVSLIVSARVLIYYSRTAHFCEVFARRTLGQRFI